MKLSKEDLKFVLYIAKEYYQNSANSDYPGKDDKKNGELFDQLFSKARYGTLEIEGYIRADHFDDAEEKLWTRYIPNKPHTHPESGEFVLTCVKGDMEVLEFKAGAGFYYYNEELGWTFVNDSYFPLFWRHLPQPPKELKESQRWRPVPKPPVETEETK